MPAPAISVLKEFDSILVYVGDMMHSHVQLSSLRGVQSWKHGENNYGIQYVMDGGNMVCEYHDVVMWKAILKRLDELI